MIPILFDRTRGREAFNITIQGGRRIGPRHPISSFYRSEGISICIDGVSSLEKKVEESALKTVLFMLSAVLGAEQKWIADNG